MLSGHSQGPGEFVITIPDDTEDDLLLHIERKDRVTKGETPPPAIRRVHAESTSCVCEETNLLRSERSTFLHSSRFAGERRLHPRHDPSSSAETLCSRSVLPKPGDGLVSLAHSRFLTDQTAFSVLSHLSSPHGGVSDERCRKVGGAVPREDGEPNGQVIA
ncbi:hypothetical protein AAFF_G00183740 [Aldrovandia affinis]|uniref:Uncharacterized protein n=1 Tax=Aldrovandia affinis TaxID=143900 RepID=A0AAD7W649_9TELE|nr:hypothetical protein AAFF_G00183740 [Aldrovandia affinis]